MNLEKIRWEQDGTTVTLKIANGKANVISRQVQEELHRALDEAEQREDVKEVVITGEGDKFFSAGADINEIAEFVLAGEGGRKEMTREERMQAAYEFSRRGQNLVLRLRNFSKPVTALINGMAFGGGFELALGCHRIIATSNALIGFPEVTLGIIPGWGGTVFIGILLRKIIKELEEDMLPESFDSDTIEKVGKLCGELKILVPGVASGFIEKGDSCTAVYLYKMRIIGELIGDEGKSERIPSSRLPAPGVASQVRAFIQRQQEYDEGEALEEEANYFADLCVLPEAEEGIRAFLEKRAPNFRKVE